MGEPLLTLLAKKAVKYAMLRSRREPFTALNDIDRKLLAYLPDGPGVFIEAGANDGFSQSNTYYLEQRRGWRGLLVEPVPMLGRLARLTRSSPVAIVALGPPEQAGQAITLHFDDLMTSPIRSGPPVNATVATISKLIDRYGLPPVDLLSLDLEGHVVPALRGLDLSRHRPRFILVEIHDPREAVAVLPGYRVADKLAPSDYLLSSS